MKTNTGNETFDLRMQELRTLRDEIRPQLHLGTQDLRDDWDRLEKQIPDTRASGQELNKDRLEAFDTLAHELRRLRENLWGRKQAEATLVASLMARTVITCRSTATLDEAARKMRDDDVGCLVVVDDDGRVAGMVTDRDCLMAAHAQNRGLDAIQVHAAMSADVYSCQPDDSLAAVADVMRARQIDRMPVLDTDGRPEGVITLSDLARAAENRPAGQG